MANNNELIEMLKRIEDKIDLLLDESEYLEVVVEDYDEDAYDEVVIDGPGCQILEGEVIK